MLVVTLIGCTRDNPAFADCDGPDSCLADESAGTGDGDPTGDGAPTGDGDPDPTGDDDPDPTGDGDPDPTGDGDPAPTGDGDGDPDPNMLPSCPDTTALKLPVVKDTFLVAAPQEGDVCIVAWDFDAWVPIFADSQVPCGGLDFGGADYHWVCNSPECMSMWLGRFNVGGWANQAPKVTSAQVEFWALVDNPEPNQVSLHSLDVDINVFGDCGDWNAGPGWGWPAQNCETTWLYSAHPTPWNIQALLGNAATLGATQVPAGELTEHQLIIPISTTSAQSWLDGESMHLGLVLRSQAFLPTEFILKAKESALPPMLVVEVCSEL